MYCDNVEPWLDEEIPRAAHYKEVYQQRDEQGNIVCQIFIRDGYQIELPALFAAKPHKAEK